MSEIWTFIGLCVKLKSKEAYFIIEMIWLFNYGKKQKNELEIRSY